MPQFPHTSSGDSQLSFWASRGHCRSGGGGRRSLPTAQVWQLLLGKGRKIPYPFLKGFGGLKRHVQAREDRPGLGKPPWRGTPQLLSSPLGQPFYLNTLPVPATLTACFPGASHRWLWCRRKPTLRRVRAARWSPYRPGQRAETPQPSGVPSPPHHSRDPTSSTSTSSGRAAPARQRPTAASTFPRRRSSARRWGSARTGARGSVASASRSRSLRR